MTAAKNILLFPLIPFIFAMACSPGSSEAKNQNPAPSALRENAAPRSAEPTSPFSFSGVALPCSFTLNDVDVQVTGVTADKVNDMPGYFTVKVVLDAHEIRGESRNTPWKDFVAVLDKENSMINLTKNVQVYGQGNRASSSGYNMSLPPNGRLIFELSYALAEKDLPAQIRFANNFILSVTAPVN